ncbi:carbohydrate ABC transporter permease [Devosia nitrariae]|uniref:Maltose/maltodextrin transport system permease protein MalG n=1 Tax=Devosia nitrariae TaxID=2071872 RepID=A0ABQ5W744_9HYPH|nr:carbohydrate ABC transporter permease [Devosia nitrariae]GLQ55601.1 ABC transporter permease [Devosia nitrariae]
MTRAYNPWVMLRWALLALLIAFVVCPFIWMVSISFKPEQEVFSKTLSILPRNPTLANYQMIFDFVPYPRFFMNSMIVAIVSTVCSLVASTLAGYSFSRFRYKGRSSLAFLVLSTQMFPLVTGIIPLYLVFSKLGLINTYWALFVAYVAFTIPFCTWMLKGFFDTIPREIEEAAVIDGCSRLEVLVRIVLPLSIPALVATSVFCFILSWNEFLYATVLTTSNDVRTLPAALGIMIGQGYTQWGGLNAAGVLTTLPVIIVFVFFQRYLVDGLTAGATKG